jgi:hypothetical protein
MFKFPITFLRGSLPGLWRLFFSPPLLPGAFPGPLGEVILPGANGQLDPEEGLVLLVSLGEGLKCTMEPSEAQEPARGVLTSDL